MHSDEVATYDISSLLVNCIHHQILLGRKQKTKRVISFVFFSSLSTRSHKSGIKTLTLLTAVDCLETIRRFNIMAVQGTFCPFKRESKD